MALLINEQTVRLLLPMADLIDAMDAALAAFSTGRVRQPVRSIVELGSHGVFGVMPAAYALDAETVDGQAGRYPHGTAAAGAKLVTVVPANHERGLPSHLATILLLDADTGALEAVVDGRYITEARTAAVSAVSARHLARPDSRVVAIIGSGVQARSHADALARVLQVHEFRVWSPTAAHREAAAREIEAATSVRATASTSARQAVEGADVVALVTSAATPVIEDAWITEAVHVIGVGACRPSQREMPGALVGRGRLIVDSRDAALKESGDILLAQKDGAHVRIAAELGEVCAGLAPGRTADDDVTIFKSLGLAVEDIVAAGLVLRRAREAGAGTPIELG